MAGMLNLPLHQLLELMQCFLGDPDSGMLNLETHRLALAIAKKTLDENSLKKLKRPWTIHHHPSGLETESTLRTTSPANRT